MQASGGLLGADPHFERSHLGCHPARTLTATATDAAGNTASQPVSYTLVAAPAVNADLVYVARSDSSPGPIHRSNSDGSNVVQLAEKGNDPVWSPDGTKVAYVELPVTGGRQIVVVNADGSGRVQLTSSTTWGASNPAWSPDGSRIVLQRQLDRGALADRAHHPPGADVGAVDRSGLDRAGGQRRDRPVRARLHPQRGEHHLRGRDQPSG